MKKETKDLAYAKQEAEQKKVNPPEGMVRKSKPENQNQQHNVKKEGTGRLNEMR